MRELLPVSTVKTTRPAPAFTTPYRSDPDDALWMAVEEICSNLIETARWHEEQCDWSQNVAAERYTSTCSAQTASGSVGPDLYSGTAGIGLFLAHAAGVVASERVKRTALGAIRQALHQAPRLLSQQRLGLYDGITGIVYCAVAVARILSQPEIEHAAVRIVEDARLADWNPNRPEIFGGLAGAICGVSELYRITGSPVLSALVANYGRKLRTCCDDLGLNLESGRMHHPANMPPIGMAHGASGIALGLASIYVHDPNPAYKRLARSLFAYEHRCLNRMTRTWRHAARASSSRVIGEAAPVGWCSGAAGMGLSRLRALELWPDTVELVEIASAAWEGATDRLKWLADEIGDVTMCHGFGGISELIVTARQLGGDDETHLTLKQAWKRLIESAKRKTLGVTDAWDGDTCRSLMVGSSGIGYALLRILEPRRVESVLLIGARPNWLGLNAAISAARPTRSTA